MSGGGRRGCEGGEGGGGVVGYVGALSMDDGGMDGAVGRWRGRVSGVRLPMNDGRMDDGCRAVRGGLTDTAVTVAMRCFSQCWMSCGLFNSGLHAAASTRGGGGGSGLFAWQSANELNALKSGGGSPVGASQQHTQPCSAATRAGAGHHVCCVTEGWVGIDCRSRC